MRPDVRFWEEYLYSPYLAEELKVLSDQNSGELEWSFIFIYFLQQNHINMLLCHIQCILRYHNLI